MLGGSGSGLGTLIEDCNIRSYGGGDGIRVRSNCSVVRNVGSGGRAIHATGNGNRIEGNMIGQGSTLVVDGVSNLLVRDHCYLPTDLQIAPGNLNAAINNAATNPPYPYPWSNFAE